MRSHSNNAIKKYKAILASELKPGDIFSEHDSPMSLLRIYDDYIEVSKDTVVYKIEKIE